MPAWNDAAELELAREAIAEAGGVPLSTTGERSHPGCAAPARGVVWMHPDGSVSPARCGASNRCWYCARIAAIETSLVLKLDAEHNTAPTVGMTLTTAAAKTTNEDLRKSVEQVTRALRRRWPGIEYCAFIEWTTGEAATSGGNRRVHVHVLLKGLELDDCEAAEELVGRVWKARTGAHRVQVRELYRAGGATAYLALHHRKRSQGPPAGWSGKRLRPSRGYFGRVGEVARLRERARALLRDKRLFRSVERELEAEFLAAGAARREVELQELDDGTIVAREVVAILAGDVWDDMTFERYLHEYEHQQSRAPILMRVRHRDVVNEATGDVHREVVEFLGPARASDLDRTLAA